jgi:parallel beta-helix repeat protein
LQNTVNENGELGISAGLGNGSIFEYNTINNNNYAGYSWVIESGGFKAGYVSNIVVASNTVSNNDGVGLWLDAYGTGAMVQGNKVSNNTLDGIRCEISHSSTISQNTLVNNVQYHGTGVCDNNSREIAVVDSDYTIVSNNTITSNCAGITLTQGHDVQMVGDQVTSNNLTLHTGSSMLTDPMGYFDNPGSTGWNIFTANPPNFFDYNRYTFDTNTAWQTVTQWVDQGGGSGDDCATDPTTCFGLDTWAGWQAHGQDIHGNAS